MYSDPGGFIGKVMANQKAAQTESAKEEPEAAVEQTAAEKAAEEKAAIEERAAAGMELHGMSGAELKAARWGEMAGKYPDLFTAAVEARTAEVKARLAGAGARKEAMRKMGM
jgi:hypothetical protein